MKCRAGLRALRQLYELTPKNVIESQFSSDLLGDVEPVRPIRIDVNLLKKQHVCIRVAQEINDF
jgi:hypothetical protein